MCEMYGEQIGLKRAIFELWMRESEFKFVTQLRKQFWRRNRMVNRLYIIVK